MADSTKIIEGIITGLLTGGTSVITTTMAVFRDVRKRLTDLETKLGAQDPKTGIYLALSLLEETTKKLRREVDAWDDDPPDWAKRLLTRARTSSSTDLSGQIQFEDRIDRNMKEFRDRLKRVEDDIEEKIERIEREVEKRLTDTPDSRILTRTEYDKDSRKRAEEMLKIREQLATANGLLRGVMSALGYIDTDKTKGR